MAKYIVTGNAGFIGSHLTERLLREGHEVVGLDDLSTGNLENLQTCFKNKNFQFIKLDISDWHQLTKSFSCFKNAEAVFHAAACARIQPSVYNPSRTHEVNTNGTFNILEIMRMTGVDKIIYSTSSSCYGKKNKTPFKETMLPDCQTPYSATKYQGEIYCKTWGDIYGIKNCSLRYFNVYGPRSPLVGQYAPVIGLFFRQVLQDNSPITVVGEGFQRRDMTYVDDVVDANIKAVEKLSDPEASQKVSGFTINIGTGMNYTIIEIAKRIKNILYGYKKDIQIIHIPERYGETPITLADNNLAKKLLNWEPTISISQGLEALRIHYLDTVFKK